MFICLFICLFTYLFVSLSVCLYSHAHPAHPQWGRGCGISLASAVSAAEALPHPSEEGPGTDQGAWRARERQEAAVSTTSATTAAAVRRTRKGREGAGLSRCVMHEDTAAGDHGISVVCVWRSVVWRSVVWCLFAARRRGARTRVCCTGRLKPRTSIFLPGFRWVLLRPNPPVARSR